MKPYVRETRDRVLHEQIRCERKFMVDVHILPICRTLWEAGIETFFSCQGGVDNVRVNTRKLHASRAYVVVLTKDKKKALRILKDLHPKADKRRGLEDPYRIAIRFDPPHLLYRLENQPF